MSPHPTPKAKEPVYHDVPAFCETLFPENEHCSVVRMPHVHSIVTQGETPRLRLPNELWLKFLQDARAQFPDTPTQESNFKGINLTRATFWHSPDYPGGVSFGWRDPTIASLDSYEQILHELRTFASCHHELTMAIRRFDKLLQRDWSYAELIERSPLLQMLKPEIKRDNLRFFFSTNCTADGALLLTVYLEATAEEVATRPPLYTGANKHLHQSFFTQNGIVRRDPNHHAREVSIARSSEYTAYAKFYIRKWNGYSPRPGKANLSVLMHPAQRARLSYEPHNDERYQNIRDLARDIERRCQNKAGYFVHTGKSDLALMVRQISDKVHALASATRSFVPPESPETLSRQLLDLVKKLPRDESLRRKVDLPSAPRYFQQDIRDLCFSAKKLSSRYRVDKGALAALVPQAAQISDACISHGATLEQAGDPVAARTLCHISAAIDILAENLQEQPHAQTVTAAIVPILRLVRELPTAPALAVSPAQPSQQRSIWLHSELRAFCETALQVAAMHRKVTRCHEAEYLVADKTTGPKRELLMLGILDLLQQSFETSDGEGWEAPGPSGINVFRFLLASEQIDRLRLVRDDANLRDKIKSVPRFLEKHFPVITTNYPLQLVDPDGSVQPTQSSAPIATIALDSIVPTPQAPRDQHQMVFDESWLAAPAPAKARSRIHITAPPSINISISFPSENSGGR